MRVVLSHRIAIVPTAPQEVLLRQAVGVARFAYNWALAEWKWRQLEHKARLYDAELVTASRWFPSSKICSACGRLSEERPLSIREWSCACGTFHDRDMTAARNLRRYALDRARCARINACGEEGSGAGLTTTVKPASLKQESAMSHLGMD